MDGLWNKVNHAVLIIDSTIYAIFFLLQNLSDGHVQRMTTILWSRWKHQNLKLWKNEMSYVQMLSIEHISL